MDRIELAAGTYYVGDLCYVLGNRWDEFCDLTIDGNDIKEGVFTMADGTQFVFFGTAYGDGLYYDQYGNEYPVDAGLIGCVLVDRVDSDANLTSGKVHAFEKAFYAVSDGKVLNFGNVSIDTDSEFEEDDYDYYDRDEEDEEYG
jgi:hypothetical protein